MYTIGNTIIILVYHDKHKFSLTFKSLNGYCLLVSVKLIHMIYGLSRRGKNGT